MEKFIQSHEESVEEKPEKGFMHSIKKTVSLAAAIAMGYMSPDTLQASDTYRQSGVDSPTKARVEIDTFANEGSEAKLFRLSTDLHDVGYSDEDIARYISREFDDMHPTAQEVKDHRWLFKWLNLEDHQAKMKRQVQEGFNPTGKTVIVEDGEMKLFSMQDSPQSYVMRDERYGESFYITAIDAASAEIEARHYFYINPQIKKTVKEFNDAERKLYKQGLLEKEPPK
ncbi:MAG: hypothetical protein HZA80_00330 [Candidatus Taylorbacteria bacterium]|nr:hypothetical protein [Candidatus Taylorbacteria bacterium]